MSVTARSSGWGGARPGSGQPRKTLSALAVERALEARERYAKRLGKEIEDIVLDVAYALDWAGEATIKQRLDAAKLVHEWTSPPISEGGEADKAGAPAVYLPEQRPDPGKVVEMKH